MRYKYQKDYENDCITICDEQEELKTSYGSEIILYPLEDASIVIDELNRKEAIIRMLYDNLLNYESEEDIKYWIAEAVDDVEEEME